MTPALEDSAGQHIAGDIPLGNADLRRAQAVDIDLQAGETHRLHEMGIHHAGNRFIAGRIFWAIA